MIHSLEIAAYFILFYFILLSLDSLKLQGRRHGRCCEEWCSGEEKGRRGREELEALAGGGRTDARQRG